MKIAYFINHYPKVSHTFIRNEILGLEELDIEVTRIALHSDQDILPDNPDFEEKVKTNYLLNSNKLILLKSLVKLSFFNFFSIIKCFLLCLKMGASSDRGLLKNIFYLGEGLLLSDKLIKENCKHVHAHFGTNSTDIAMYASLISGIPFSFTVHGPEEFDRPFGINLAEKIKRADSVFAITSFCRSQLFRWSSYKDWSKIRIIHCALGELFFNDKNEVKDSGPHGKKLNMLCIGRLCEQKGQMLLLQALPILIESGIDFHLTFAGDGELRAPMQEFINANNLKDRVTITGWVDSLQIKELLKKSTLMVLPSFAEGLPVAIMEALALKTPVLTTRINGIPELIEHQKSGILVTPGSKLSLVSGIKLFNKMSRQARESLIDEGFKRVKKEHSSATEAGKIKDYLMLGK
ncbi:glycosyltransferase [Alteromonas stellipolaris]|uniref:glycosyltransferase n=1 Tax=Alteromonas stellipolaris TaxID=233316 RepID=UPI00211977EB|nr:glycosyltransferase [Alteromonas stellipolaris]MCQ8847331.1 glycosyltransferase [Alteromonas stellipolaris]